MNCEYVKEIYGVPAEIGKRIDYKGRGGIISEDRGNYVGVNFDSDKPGVVSNVHPTDPGLVYLEEMGKIRQLTRSQQRYREYLDADWFGDSFADWLGIRRKNAY